MISRNNVLFLLCVYAVVGCAAQDSSSDERSGTVVNSIGMRFQCIPVGTLASGTRDKDKHFTTRRKYYEPNARGIGPSLVLVRLEDMMKLEDVWEMPAVFSISKGFYLGIHEVTNGQFRKYMVEHNGSTVNDQLLDRFQAGRMALDELLIIQPLYDAVKKQRLDASDQPVVGVSAQQAEAFCRWLSELPAERRAGRIYRLPTEHEWEYACRAGTTGPFYWDGGVANAYQYENFADLPSHAAWACWKYPFPGKDGYVGASPVGAFEPNPNGLYDMLGNVMEITVASPDPTRKSSWSGSYVLKGSSWISPQDITTAAFRWPVVAHRSWFNIGFRVVMETRNATVLDE